MDDDEPGASTLARIGGGIVVSLLGLLWFGLMIRYPVLWLVPTVVGVGWIVANEKKMRDTPDPAPPPVPEVAEGEIVQFRTYEDRPGHWTVVKIKSGENQ